MDEDEDAFPRWHEEKAPAHRQSEPVGAGVEFPLRFQLVPCRFSSVADGIVGGEGRLTGHRPAADA